VHCGTGRKPPDRPHPSAACGDVSGAVLLTCRAVLSVRELRAGGDGAAEVEGRATLTSVRELLERAIALTVAERTEDYVTYQ
jgi:hypothetical protein